MATKDRMTFEEAVKELQITEEELEQLVANGEIASIKEGDTFFFKREVIAQFKKSRKTEPTIILADEDMEILDVMDEIDLTSSDEPARPAARSAAAKGAEDDKVTDLLADADEISIEPRGETGKARAGQPAAGSGVAGSGVTDDTVLNLEGLLEDDGSEGTTPIPGAEIGARMPDESGDITVEGTVSDETLLDTDLLEIGEEEDSFKLDTTADDALTDPSEATLLRGGGARAMQMKRRKSHTALTVLLALTVALLLVPLGISMNTVYVTALGTDQAGEKDTVYKWVQDCADLPVLGRQWVEMIADLFGG